MADDRHAPGEACCQACEAFAGREPPARGEGPALRLRPDEAVVRVRHRGQWREERPGKAEVVFGRAAAADVVLADATISRRQFTLRFVEEGVEVEDMQSACGTYVDGRQVTRAMLPEGGEIAVGDFVVQVVRS